MRHVVLDIETVPDPDFPPPEKEVGSPASSVVVAIGCLYFEDYLPSKIGLIRESGSEAEKIADLMAWLGSVKPTIVSWNGRGFDMPVLSARALRYGVPMPWWYESRNTRYRYSTEGHFDLMDFLADHGAGRNMRLGDVAKLVGFPGKMGVDGSQVGTMMAEEGGPKAVGTYCLCDVAQTAAVFLRVELLRGEIDRATYLGLASKYLQFLDAEPRIAELAGKIDQPRFLLE